MAHYLIGDIHGCWKELQALERLVLSRIGRGAAHFVSVGDLIDRGPGSLEVLEHFRQGGIAGTHSAVLGNHEELLLKNFYHFRPDLFDRAEVAFPASLRSTVQEHEERRWIAHAISLEDYAITTKSLWLGQGGAETVRSLGGDSLDPRTWTIEPALLRWLCGLPIHWENSKCVVTHALASREAMVAVREGLGAESYAKHCNQAIWSRIPPVLRPDSKRVHVSGHTPVDKIRRYLRGSVIQIDTGCVYGKRLTAYCVEKRRAVSVPSETHWKGGKH